MADTYNFMIPAIACDCSDVYTDDTPNSGNYLPDHPIMQDCTTITGYEGPPYQHLTGYCGNLRGCRLGRWDNAGCSEGRGP